MPKADVVKATETFIERLDNDTRKAISDLLQSDTDPRMEIAQRYLKSETVDDILSDDSDVVELPAGACFRIHKLRLAPSTIANSEGLWPFFAILEITVLDTYGGSQTDTQIATIGGDSVLAQLLAIYKLGQFPVDVRLITKQTSNGLFVKKLVKFKVEEGF